MSKLSVAETFISIQGEGSTMGRLAVFLRLAGCNLLCGENDATWKCDTIEVWKKGTANEFDEILSAKHLAALEAGAHLVITGGEPLLQWAAILEFMDWIRGRVKLPVDFEIETNGTLFPADYAWRIDRYNISPKLSNSGVRKEDRYKPDIIESFAFEPLACFKFVIYNQMDLDEMVRDYFPYIHDKYNIWLMPAADSREELDRISAMVAQAAIDLNVNFSSRLHIALWDRKTGV